MTQREEKKGVQLEVVMRRIAPHLQEIYPGLLGVSPSYPFTFIIFFFLPPFHFLFVFWFVFGSGFNIQKYAPSL